MEVEALDSLRIVLDPIGQVGVALALMLVMFSVALGLRVRDFSFLRTHPLLFVGGVVSQVVLLPLGTFLLILLMEPAASIALGMIVVACCPGGAVSNLLTYLSRGNVAASVALTNVRTRESSSLAVQTSIRWSRLAWMGAALNCTKRSRSPAKSRAARRRPLPCPRIRSLVDLPSSFLSPC